MSTYFRREGDEVIMVVEQPIIGRAEMSRLFDEQLCLRGLDGSDVEMTDDYVNGMLDDITGALGETEFLIDRLVDGYRDEAFESASRDVGRLLDNMTRGGRA